MTKLLASQSNAMCKVDTEHESVHRLISGSQQDIQMTPSSLPLMDRETLTPLLTTTLEKTLSPILEKRLMECLSEFGAALPTRHEPRELHSQRDQKKEIDRESLTRSGAPENSRVYRQRLSMVKRRKCVFWRDFRTLFGYVYFYCDIVSQNWTAMPLHDEDWVYEFRFAFLPRPSLSRRASFISGTWAPSPDCSLTALNFQFRPLLDSGSPIFKACKAGDIDTMKYLFQTKQASPHVIDLDGNDLLLVSTLVSASFQCTYDITSML